VKFGEFEARARSEWDRIPGEFKEGVDGLVVERGTKAGTAGSDTWTLGECLTENYPSDYDGPDSVRSEVVLYWGSFHQLARTDPEFDWEQEIWETLTHELRHHLESLARESALDSVDAGLAQHYRRMDGATFDPYYYRCGEERGHGWFTLEDVWFCEIPHAEPGRVEFDWSGKRYGVRFRETGADILFLEVIGGVERAPGSLSLVVLRRRRLLERLRAVFSGRPAHVETIEVEAVAQ